MQRSRYTHIAKQVFPYSQESTTGSLHKHTTYSLPLIDTTTYLSLYRKTLFIIGGESDLIGSIIDVFSSRLLRKIGKI